MKINKIISVTVASGLSCSFAGAFASSAYYSEEQLAAKINEAMKKDSADGFGSTILKIVKDSLGVTSYADLFGYVSDEGDILVNKMTDKQKDNLLSSLIANGYCVNKINDGYDICQSNGTLVISAADLKRELKTAKTTEQTSIINTPTSESSGFIGGGSFSSGSSSTSTTSSNNNNTTTTQNTNYAGIGKEGKVVEINGVLEFASSGSGKLLHYGSVNLEQSKKEGKELKVNIVTMLDDANKKGMSTLVLPIAESGKDASTQTKWAFDAKAVNQSIVNSFVEGFNPAVAINNYSETYTIPTPNVSNNAEVQAVTNLKTAMASVKDKSAIKVIDFAAPDGTRLPVDAAVRVNVGAVGKYRVFFIINGKCYDLNAEVITDKKGNVVCNINPDSAIGDFILVPVENK